MKFIYPQFLLALTVLLIPLIIHFFKFKRYKTIYFSQVGFLKAVQQETKKKSDLKKLLILISRLLMIMALILAFSQPYMPVNKNETIKNNQSVAIYLDNSFSMMAENEEGSIFEQAKARVIDIVNSFDQGTKFFLLTNNVIPANQIPLGKEELMEQLSRVKESPKALKISEAYRLMLNSLNNEDDKSEKNLFLVSDCQSYQLDFSTIKEDSTSRVLLVHFNTSENNNLLIDSCWFDSPARKSNKQEKLLVRVVNQSKQRIQNQPLRLLINDSLKAINNINMEAGESQLIELNYKNITSGFQKGVIELDDFPITYDNKTYFSYLVKTSINCLLISNISSNSTKHFETLLGNDPFINFQQIESNKFRPNQLSQSNLVILHNLNEISSGMNKALSLFIENGGSLCIFPGDEVNFSSYNQFYRNINCNELVALDSSYLRMSTINKNHLVFNDVFEQIDEEIQLPEIRLSYRYTKLPSVEQNTLIGLISGQPAISETSFGKGHVYNFNFPVSNQNEPFLTDALFVSLIYNIALNSIEGYPIHFNIENLMFIEVSKEKTNTPPFSIKSSDQEEQFRVSVLNESPNRVRLDLSNFINEAGFADLFAGEQLIKKLAFNYNRSESKSKNLSFEEVRNLITENGLENIQLIESNPDNFGNQIQEINKGKELWLVFVIQALVFLFTETAIIRWMK